MGLSLLMVDDDETTLHIYSLFFKKCNYPGPIVQAINCKLAYNIIVADTSTQYIVVLDLYAPEMTGWEFLNLVQQLPVSPIIYVVVMTCSKNHADQQKAYTYKQVMGYYEKPLRMEICYKINEYATNYLLRGHLQTL